MGPKLRSWRQPFWQAFDERGWEVVDSLGTHLLPADPGPGAPSKPKLRGRLHETWDILFTTTRANIDWKTLKNHQIVSFFEAKP
jgi:hypothetical protein